MGENTDFLKYYLLRWEKMVIVKQWGGSLEGLISLHCYFPDELMGQKLTSPVDFRIFLAEKKKKMKGEAENED